MLTHLTRFLGRLPLSVIEVLGRSLGSIAYLADIRHRRIVHHNLSFVFPQMNHGQTRDLAKRIFHHFGIVLFEMLQIPFIPKLKLAERVQVEGLDILTRAMEHPRGCLVYSAHLGNWELGFLALSAKLNKSVVTVAKPIKWNLAHRWLMTLRSRFGSRIVFKEGAMSFMRETLRSGETIALLIDQGVRQKEAIEVRFFGKRTWATPGVAFLALRGGTPVVPVFCVRGTGGKYQIKVMPPVTIARSSSLRYDILAFTQALMKSLEDVIRDHPEQWFWFHKRWKRTYPDLYPEYQQLRRRRRRKKGLRD